MQAGSVNKLGTKGIGTVIGTVIGNRNKEITPENSRTPHTPSIDSVVLFFPEKRPSIGCRMSVGDK